MYGRKKKLILAHRIRNKGEHKLIGRLGGFQLPSDCSNRSVRKQIIFYYK